MLAAAATVVLAVFGAVACGSPQEAVERTTTIAEAVITEPPTTSTPSSVIASWEMDEPAGASDLVDGGPLGLGGRIGTAVETGVREQGVTAHRRVHVDPDAPPADRERLATVPDDPRLRPGSGDFAVTVRLRTDYPQGNVVQKGQVDVPGGYFKVDMDEGRVSCLFLGSAGSASVRSPGSIADGAWHEVRCVRSGDELVLAVDSVVVARRGKPTGEVTNTFPVTIAGKLECDQVTLGCDYFSGDIDRVQLDRSSSPVTPPA